MSATIEFYLARATACAREATETKLDNVRERCLRAESAWRMMADRLMKGDEDRARRAAEKAVQDPGRGQEPEPDAESESELEPENCSED